MNNNQRISNGCRAEVVCVVWYAENLQFVLLRLFKRGAGRELQEQRQNSASKDNEFSWNHNYEMKC